MMFTHEQLTQAVREIGRDGKAFSSAAVRKFLGMSEQDKRALTRFNNEFREFQKTASDELEKLANNRYRLCRAAFASESNPAVETASPSVIEVASPSVIEGAAVAEATAAQAIAPLDRPSHAQTRVEIHDATPQSEREGSAVQVKLAARGDRPAAFERLRPALRRALVRGYRLGVHVAAHVSRASGALRSRRGQAPADAAPIDAAGG